MALNTVLVLAAGLGFGGGQEPSLDTQIVAPVLAKTSTSTNVTTETTADDKITVQFRDAKAGEVLSWLEKHGVNFVISSGEIPDNTRITLNVQDQPIDKVVDAIARALGGHWEKEDKVRVFKRGSANPWGPDVTVRSVPGSAFGDGKANPFGQGKATPFGEFKGKSGFQPFSKMPSMPAMPAMPFKFEGQFNGKPMNQEEFEKQFGKDFQKKMEAWGEKMNKEFGPEFQKKMEAWGKEMEKQYSPEAMEKLRSEAMAQGRIYKLDKEGVYKLDKEGIAKFRAEAEKAREEGARARVEGAKARAEGARARAQGEQARTEAERAVRERVRVFGQSQAQGRGGNYFFTRPDGRDRVSGFGIGNSLDVQKFMKGLTSNQKDTQRKRGYIRYSDLTASQKALLGDRPDGRFEITFKVNGDEITIRND